jgi:hypothetical protein
MGVMLGSNLCSSGGFRRGEAGFGEFLGTCRSWIREDAGLFVLAAREAK